MSHKVSYRQRVGRCPAESLAGTSPWEDRTHWSLVTRKFSSVLSVPQDPVLLLCGMSQEVEGGQPL
jgi:hypothetical protein